MDWSQEQLNILDQASKKATPAYLRMRSLSVWHVAQGKTCIEAAHFTRSTRQSVGKWVRNFRLHGLIGLLNQKGRGKKTPLSHADVEDYLNKLPHDLGLNQTRWTLVSLAEKVPSLRGYSPAGVLKVLNKLGFGYKRGQPHLHSPDPQYLEKKRSLKK